MKNKSENCAYCSREITLDYWLSKNNNKKYCTYYCEKMDEIGLSINTQLDDNNWISGDYRFKTGY